MILYTQRAMCGHAHLDPDCETKGKEGKRNREAIEAEAQLNLLMTNTALFHSNSESRVRLVHVGLDEFVYPSEVDPTDSLQATYRSILENENNGESIIFDNVEVHKLRERVGADVVALFIDKNYSEDLNDFNGLSGDVIGGDDSCDDDITTNPSFNEQLNACTDRAYVVLTRNGRHQFMLTHELYHMFRGNGHTGVCNSDPCFQSLGKERGGCSECKDADGNDLLQNGGGVLVPRIPLFTGDGVEFSGVSLDVAETCKLFDHSSGDTVQATDAECFDLNAPFLSKFKPKKNHKPIKFALAGTMLAFAVGIAFAAKKRHQAKVVLLEVDDDIPEIDACASPIFQVHQPSYNPPVTEIAEIHSQDVAHSTSQVLPFGATDIYGHEGRHKDDGDLLTGGESRIESTDEDDTTIVTCDLDHKECEGVGPPETITVARKDKTDAEPQVVSSDCI